MEDEPKKPKNSTIIKYHFTERNLILDASFALLSKKLTNKLKKIIVETLAGNWLFNQDLTWVSFEFDF